MLRARSKGGVKKISDRFRSLTRVYPSQDPNDQQVYELVRDLRLFFMKLTKGQLELTGYDFERTFYASKFLTQKCGFKRVDLTILFQKASKSERSIDFFIFTDLLQLLSEKCASFCQNEISNIVDFIKILEL